MSFIQVTNTIRRELLALFTGKHVVELCAGSLIPAMTLAPYTASYTAIDKLTPPSYAAGIEKLTYIQALLNDVTVDPKWQVMFCAWPYMFGHNTLAARLASQVEHIAYVVNNVDAVICYDPFFTNNWRHGSRFHPVVKAIAHRKNNLIILGPRTSKAREPLFDEEQMSYFSAIEMHTFDSVDWVKEGYKLDKSRIIPNKEPIVL
jgi:hypothetical protein